MRAELGEQILHTLQRRQPPAAFIAEVAAALQPAQPAEIEETIARLDEVGQLLVVPHAAPDIHLESTDLRVIAPVPDPQDESAARDAAEEFWGMWLRTFLANHHCE